MPEIDWLAVLTAAVVVITGYYAWQTRQTVLELRAARGAAIQPRLVTRWTVLGPMAAFPRIENVGTGPALDVDVEMSYEPGHGLARRWRTAVLTPGQGTDFITRNESGQPQANIGAYTEKYEHIRLVGSYRDALGTEHRVDDLMEIRETWDLARSSSQRVPPDHPKKTVDYLERIAKALESGEHRAQRKEWVEWDAQAVGEETDGPGESTASDESERDGAGEG